MRKASFRRGIHPPEMKLTAASPIKEIFPAQGSILVFPMVQHIGRPAQPVVEVGDKVLVGQKLGEADAHVSSPVLSSVSGTVKEIREALSPRGSSFNSVFVENDGMYQWQPGFGEGHDYKNMPKDQLLSIIKEAGIVGLGGAGFPVHVKLEPPADKKIDTFIVNASECEPYLTTDHRALLEKTDVILLGVDIILTMFPEIKCIIAIEDNKPDAIQKLTEANKDERITVVAMETKYPQGGEKQLIYACTKREVPSGGFPMDIGCIVNNVDTVISIAKAVVMGIPLTKRVVTVSGGAVSNPGNYEVPLGFIITDLVEATGGLKAEPFKVVAGGPMMGIAMTTMDVPLIKTTSAIILLTEKEAERPPERNCFRCAKCIDHCPMWLIPGELGQLANLGHKDRFKEYNGLDCILCACCSYVCPANRPIAQSIDGMKKIIAASK